MAEVAKATANKQRSVKILLQLVLLAIGVSIAGGRGKYPKSKIDSKICDEIRNLCFFSGNFLLSSSTESNLPFIIFF
jgi:hypothetical protein